MKRLLILALVGGCAVSSFAKVVLPNILGSNMVIQQQADVNFWGTANPNTKVSVKTSWSNQEVETKSDVPVKAIWRCLCTVTTVRL